MAELLLPTITEPSAETPAAYASLPPGSTPKFFIPSELVQRKACWWLKSSQLQPTTVNPSAEMACAMLLASPGKNPNLWNDCADAAGAASVTKSAAITPGIVRSREQKCATKGVITPLLSLQNNACGSEPPPCMILHALVASVSRCSGSHCQRF